jgi:hypothetical protein
MDKNTKGDNMISKNKIVKLVTSEERKLLENENRAKKLLCIYSKARDTIQRIVNKIETIQIPFSCFLVEQDDGLYVMATLPNDDHFPLAVLGKDGYISYINDEILGDTHVTLSKKPDSTRITSSLFINLDGDKLIFELFSSGVSFGANTMIIRVCDFPSANILAINSTVEGCEKCNSCLNRSGLQFDTSKGKLLTRINEELTKRINKETAEKFSALETKN